ncbi:N-acetyl sugar amidotransferase [Candidatus Omnitrophota bacterium]
MTRKQIICQRCICDTSIPGIRFDSGGICNFCRIHDEMEKLYPLSPEGVQKLHHIVEKIKKSGKKNDYDCVVGVSGGRDSTYLLYSAVRLGLRPLAVHFDNGWNSEIAVTNIKNVTEKLKVDLHTYVADWDEFKNLQIAFLKASVSDAEIPTDVAIFGTLYQVAASEGIKYILNGHSFRTEGIMPIGWTYMDGRYMYSVNKIFGNKRLKTVPNFTLFDYFKYVLVKRIEMIPLLNFFEYNQQKINEILERELDWRYYGGHHHESYYTHFFQSYLLPKKFNIDKRKIEYSALVRSRQMNRSDALRLIEDASYPYDEDLLDYVKSKLGMTSTEFEKILDDGLKRFYDYPTYYPFIKSLKFFIWLAYRFNLISEVLYLKYLG